MKNETRRRIANWLLKIPGFIEAFDQVEDIRIAKTVATLVKDRHEEIHPIQPSWLLGKHEDDWSRSEARLVLDRIRQLKDASVEFKDNKIAVMFDSQDGAKS